MVIKKYIVNNMNEAMTRIRYELGKDAVIISQRKIKKPGFVGLFSKKVLEVTAAVDNRKKDEEKNVHNSIEIIKKIMEKNNNESKEKKQFKNNELTNLNNKDSKEAILDKKIDKEKTYEDEIFKEMKQMKEMLNSIIKDNKETNKSEDGEIKKMLQDNDLSHQIIETIMDKLEDVDNDLTDMENLKNIIIGMININKLNDDKEIVFVGPTGVGKTTTIAKLAGRLALIDKKKVGLITIDTYRIGAVEQLKTYADIMNIPFKVVFSIKDMELAVESMKDCDNILIDTTGRSSKNAMQVSELRAFIEKINTDNIHLVVSCTTKNRDIKSIIEGYKSLKFNNVIITKLDETTTYGSIMNISEYASKPISFITTGQNVPDDIKVVTKEEIADLILGEDNIC